MNSRELETQARLQELAELAERQHLPASGDSSLDRYRLVLRALRQPPAVQLPADFAAQVAARVGSAEEKGSLEDWLVTLLLLGMAVVGVIYVQPVLASVLGQLQFEVPTLPWSWLAAAAASVGVAWAVDRGVAGWWEEGHRG